MSKQKRANPTRQVFQDMEKASTIEGAIDMATSGDLGAVSALLEWFCRIVAEGQPPPAEILDYLAECFDRILEGESADVVFCLTPGRRGRPPEHSEQRYRKFIMAARYNDLRDNGKDHKSALEQISQEFSASESTIKKAVSDYALPRR